MNKRRISFALVLALFFSTRFGAQAQVQAPPDPFLAQIERVLAETLAAANSPEGKRWIVGCAAVTLCKVALFAAPIWAPSLLVYYVVNNDTSPPANRSVSIRPWAPDQFKIPHLPNLPPIVVGDHTFIPGYAHVINLDDPADEELVEETALEFDLIPSTLKPYVYSVPSGLPIVSATDRDPSGRSRRRNISRKHLPADEPLYDIAADIEASFLALSFRYTEMSRYLSEEQREGLEGLINHLRSLIKEMKEAVRFQERMGVERLIHQLPATHELIQTTLVCVWNMLDEKLSPQLKKRLPLYLEKLLEFRSKVRQGIKSYQPLVEPITRENLEGVLREVRFDHPGRQLNLFFIAPYTDLEIRMTDFKEALKKLLEFSDANELRISVYPRGEDIMVEASEMDENEENYYSGTKPTPILEKEVVILPSVTPTGLFFCREARRDRGHVIEIARLRMGSHDRSGPDLPTLRIDLVGWRFPPKFSPE